MLCIQEIPLRVNEFLTKESQMKPIILIPARLQSMRLPRKMLADIHGKPLIQYVVEEALASKVGPVYVACAEVEIKAVVESIGGKAVLTDPSHSSGSDRIFEALQKIDPDQTFDTVINLQGDLPTVKSDIFKTLLTPFDKNPSYDISTIGFEMHDADEIQNPNVVKIVFGGTPPIGQGLYFTRGVPYGEGPFYHHVGIYAYRRQALERFVKLPPSVLEKRERLEQLRALEDGMTIGVVIADSGPFGVDTPEDLEKARALLK